MAECCIALERLANCSVFDFHWMLQILTKPHEVHITKKEEGSNEITRVSIVSSISFLKSSYTKIVFNFWLLIRLRNYDS